MLYPVYVCPGNETVPHSLYIPDIPGCVGTLDDWKKLPHAIQEAVELHFEGENLEIPPPSGLETYSGCPSYAGGMWMMARIDISRVRNNPPSRLVAPVSIHDETRGMDILGALPERLDGVSRAT